MVLPLPRRPGMANTTDPKKLSKSQQVEKLLKRPRGATTAELMADTGWQAHSVRAFLTGLRKKGHTISKEERKPGLVAFCIASMAPAPTTEAKDETAATAAEVNA
jgi:hypothetical protein